MAITSYMDDFNRDEEFGPGTIFPTKEDYLRVRNMPSGPAKKAELERLTRASRPPTAAEKLADAPRVANVRGLGEGSSAVAETDGGVAENLRKLRGEPPAPGIKVLPTTITYDEPEPEAEPDFTSIRGLAAGSSAEPAPEEEALNRLGGMKKPPFDPKRPLAESDAWLDQENERLTEAKKPRPALAESDAWLARENSDVGNPWVMPTVDGREVPSGLLTPEHRAVLKNAPPEKQQFLMRELLASRNKKLRDEADAAVSSADQMHLESQADRNDNRYVNQMARKGKLDRLRGDATEAVASMVAEYGRSKQAEMENGTQNIMRMQKGDPASDARFRASAAVRSMEHEAERNDKAYLDDLSSQNEANALAMMKTPGKFGNAEKALAKYQAMKAPKPKLATGSSSLSPTPERPQFGKDFLSMQEELESPGKPPGQPSPRQPLMAAQGMVQGAKPDTSAEEEELRAAAEARDSTLLAAQIASQFGHYADVAGGTQTGDKGAALRASADNKLGDVKAKYDIRRKAMAEQQANEERAFEREGINLQRGDAARKRQNDIDYNDGASQVSQRRRAQAAAFYPELVGKIDPKVWGSMSASDIDTFLKEAAPAKILGGSKTGAGGAAGGKPLKMGEMNALRRGLPPKLVDTYRNLQDAKAEIESMGGWTKVKSGLLGSMTPTMFMDPQNQKVRQTVGRVVSAFLQAGGGKAITSQEERIILGKIAADPTSFGVTPQMLELGLGLVEGAMANDTMQALAGAPEEAKNAIYGDLPEGMREWAEQRAPQPKKPGVKPQGVRKPKRLIVRNPKTGERRYFNPQTQQFEEAVP